jgi:iron-sulfur cluster repair protein YtfE (RIC family)
MGSNLSEKELDELAGLVERPQVKPTGRPRKNDIAKISTSFKLSGNAVHTLKILGRVWGITESATIERLLAQYHESHRAIFEQYEEAIEKIRALDRELEQKISQKDAGE